MPVTEQDVLTVYNTVFDKLREMAEAVEEASTDDLTTPQDESRISFQEGLIISATAMNLAMYLVPIFRRDHKHMDIYADVAGRVVLSLPDAG